MNWVTNSRDGAGINNQTSENSAHTLAFLIYLIGKQMQIIEAFQLSQHKSYIVKGKCMKKNQFSDDFVLPLHIYIEYFCVALIFTHKTHILNVNTTYCKQRLMFPSVFWHINTITFIAFIT